MVQTPLIAGVGMSAFTTPRNAAPYTAAVGEAVRDCLVDAGIDLSVVEQIYAGYVYGDSTSGQRAIYEVGLTGAPIINVNNNCATGSSALFLAAQAVAHGAAECALAFGFEQMGRGALAAQYDDRPSPFDRFLDIVERKYGPSEAPMAARLFGAAGREYAERFGTRNETFAKITVKARRHAAANPKAVFRDLTSVEEVLASPEMFAPLTRLQCCPPSCGAAAAILVSPELARRNGLTRAIRLRAIALTSDSAESFDGSAIHAVGASMTRAAARKCYEAAAIAPEDVDVVELHDCFTANEILSYEALGLAAEGGAERMIEDGDNTYGGRYVVNPSGGLISKGHPLGATGLAQCYELVSQLRGEAGARQVEGARLALQHNIGLGGAAVVSILERA